MSVHNYKELKQHIGHDIVCVGYGKTGDRNWFGYRVSVAIECNTCNEVLISYDKPLKNKKKKTK